MIPTKEERKKEGSKGEKQKTRPSFSSYSLSYRRHEVLTAATAATAEAEEVGE